ncbi:spore germination protein [Fontibacillus phaseoli]|uniref:Spore germination protein n=1 Tax=Fontibacillus phaseoli TaxID=1416533 RepID=A0A369BH26_9BACL|nr:spore germination protein [Fontibacillus phaseoli]RCX20565.1 spore germination protein [Fontibacillus phaseoli]
MSSKTREQEVSWLSETMSGQVDFEQRMLGSSGEIGLQYLRSLTNSDTISRYVIVPGYEMEDVKAFESYISSFPGTIQTGERQQILEYVLKGFAYIRIASRGYLFDAVKVESSGVGEAVNESIVQGPRDALSESIEMNLNLIRRRYQSAALKVDMLTLGKVSHTSVAILYDNDRVDQQVLKEMKKRIADVDIDILQSAGELEKYITPERFRIFPTMVVTERPDRVVFNIAEGKVAVIIDSNGFAIIAPVVFSDFFTAMDDKIQVPLVGWFLKIIRYIGLFLTLTLPALYVTFASYNPEILKVQISLLIAGSRAAVPYPSFMEVFLMLLMMEFLTEASLRLPKAIGPTATTVGGLILGQAATQAGLVSNIMIILVSAVAISNFIIPLSMMGYTIRVIKYGMVLFAITFGLVGIVVSIVGLIMYLSGLRSFGRPYMKMFALDSKVKGGQ